MKTLLIFIICLMSCSNIDKSQEKSFKLDLWDYNSSMAYTLHYHFDNNGIFVRSVGGLENELPDTLIKKGLSEEELDIIYAFLNDMPIDSLNNEYIDPLTEDGDQKKIELTINLKTKNIMVSNIYQKDISSLIDLMNQFLDEDLKIEYRKE